MNSLRIGLLILAAQVLGFSQIFAQIKGLFEKEAPIFNASVVPTMEDGTVLLVFHFTHSKATSIETSLWLRDEGTSLGSTGTATLLRGLKEIGNRQQDTLVVKGLVPQHFYTFGLDYRTAGFMSSKFTAANLKSGFRYEGVIKKDVLIKEESREMETTPCENPDIFVQVESNGYCSDDRPAVQVQCTNCQGRNWEFNVQLRLESGAWESLRADGKSQSAAGNGMRVEPLCTVQPGTYYVRVLARDANCPNPIVHNVGTPVVIRSANNNATKQVATTNSKERETISLPDTCVVRTKAIVTNNAIKGTIELTANSPCGNFHPYTEVNYVHPGYRDVVSKPIQLTAGTAVPFEITLDSRDLSRGIHTLQLITYISPEANAEGIPMSAYWIKATNAKTTDAEPVAVKESTSQETLVKQDASKPYETAQQVVADANELGNEMDEVTVRATDPNCNQIQDLRMVYFSNQSDRPLYISWMNPRCCQEDGCKYTVWAGPDPDHLRILVEGSKRGTFIKELVQELITTDTYLEIGVKTSNGTRKAAYVIGEGAKYGIEEILTYRDRLNPQKVDPIVVEVEVPAQSQPIATTNEAAVKQEITKPSTGMVGGDLAARGVTTPAVLYQKPQIAIVDFKPCKYARETLVVANRPAKEGEQVKIQYDFSDKDYRYTLYLQPQNSTEWVIAPGTKEMQENPIFDLKVTSFHAGKYVILVKKAEATWGCLAQPIEQPIDIQVVKR